MTDKISSMRNVHPHTVCCCLTDGKILNWDKRENTPNVFDTGCDHSVQWTMDLLGNDMIQLSSRGHVQWIDMRKPNQAIYLNNTGLSTNDAQFLRIHLKVHCRSALVLCIVYAALTFPLSIAYFQTKFTLISVLKLQANIVFSDNLSFRAFIHKHQSNISWESGL